MAFVLAILKLKKEKKRSNRAIRAFILKLVGYSQKGGMFLGSESIEE